MSDIDPELREYVAKQLGNMQTSAGALFGDAAPYRLLEEGDVLEHPLFRGVEQRQA